MGKPPKTAKPAVRRVSPKLRARAAEILARLAEATPEPRTELNYQSPYTLVVAVALSAQATDVSVNKATERLFAVASTPAAMLELGEAGLADTIKSIGLFRTKARNVIALSQFSSTSTAPRFRCIERRCRPCRASAARPRAWC